MLSDFTGADKVYIACGYTDLRRGIDGLATIIQQEFQLDPFTNTFAYSPKSRYNMGTIKIQGGSHMTITYTQIGDYLLPNLVPPESPKVGCWGMLRHSYLRNYREGLYTGMLMKGILNAHLEEVDRQANEMEQRLISQLAQQEGITEQLKAANQLEWVRRMNSIRKRVDEIILQELIYI